jgi:dienelactone hydrolase
MLKKLFLFFSPKNTGNTLILVFVLSLSSTSFAQDFNVGHTTKTFFDTTRNRNIETEIYYPATTSGDDVAIASGNYPVLVFGHGFVMVWSAYANFWQELVPKGYIMCFPKTEVGLAPSHANFGNDLKYIASAMQSENEISTSLFFNAVTPKTALMGHSMGGGASFLGAANNTNITTLINFAAAETNPSAIAAAANVTVPTLVFSGDDDCVVPEAANQNVMYTNLASACKTQVSIINGGHCYYANSNFNCNFGEFTCNSSLDITRAQQQAITFSFLEPWLNFYLKDNTSSESIFNNLLESSNQVNYSQSCSTLGNQEAVSEYGIMMFPNPVNDVLTIKFSAENLGGNFSIYNEIGQMVQQSKIENKETQLNLSELSDGLYFMTYSKDSFTSSGKFVKVSGK